MCCDLSVASVVHSLFNRHCGNSSLVQPDALTVHVHAPDVKGPSGCLPLLVLTIYALLGRVQFC
jgi:hypothetical protein